MTLRTLFDSAQLSDEYGKKSQNLHFIIQKGFPAKNGVVIPIYYYDIYMKVKASKIKYFDIVDDMRGLLSNMWEMVNKLIDLPLIVRSSTHEEDSSEYSYAGIYESVSPVYTYDDFIKSLFIVWDSYNSNQAIQYRNDANQLSSGIAILIQQWVEADLKGVAFSCDPRTGKNCIMVEIINKTYSTNIARRYCITNSEVKIDDTEFDNTILTETEKNVILSVCEFTKKIKAVMETHVDVEWIWNNKLYIVQVRPITAGLISDNDNIYSFPPSTRTTCCLLDRYSQPATLAYLSLLAHWQERVYLDMRSNKLGRDICTKPLLFYYNRVYWNLDYQKLYYDIANNDLDDIRINDSKLYEMIIDGADNWYSRLPEYQERLEMIDASIFVNLPKPHLKQQLLDVISLFCDGIGIDHYQMLGMADICYGLLQKTLDSIPENKYKATELLTSRQTNQTVESNNQLYEIAEYICLDPLYRKVFIDKTPEDILLLFEDNLLYEPLKNRIMIFLKIHGHRGTGCDDLYSPHWAEAPDLLVQLLKQYCNIIMSKPAREAISQKTTVLDLTLSHPVLNEIIELASKYMNLREDQRYYFDKSWIVLRKLFLEIGSRMKKSEEIESVEDVFFFSYSEILLWFDTEDKGSKIAKIRQRKKFFLQSQKFVPPYFIKNGEALIVQKQGKHRSYKVTVVSSGYAIGKPRYVGSIENLSDVQYGDILVVPTFHPSWTPILNIAGGIVMNYGNILSHGAVVAREYGIPVVIYNGSTESIFQEDHILEVDAISGRLRVGEAYKEP